MENTRNVHLAEELIISLLGDNGGVPFLNVTNDEGGLRKDFLMAMKTLVTHLAEINDLDTTKKEEFEKKFKEIRQTIPSGQETMINAVDRGMCAVGAWRMGS